MDDAESLSARATELVRQAQTTGDVAALEDAITLFEDVVAATPSDHPDRPRFLSNLGAALRVRFERVGSLADLDRAISLGEDAVAAAASDDPEREMFLSNLGLALATRFKRVGSLADLDRAIGLGEDAVAATPSDHPDRAGRLTNLGLALATRFERVGSLADLDRAVSVFAESVAATPRDHPNRAARLSNLGAALRTRFERVGSVADLDRAIGVIEEAVAATPSDNPNRAVRLSNLGAALQTRFEEVGSMADLDRAITVGEEAVAGTPSDHSNRALQLSNLGAALQTRFERVGSVADLDRAISLCEKALAAIPTDRPDRAIYLSNLGYVLQTRFERFGGQHDCERAVGVFRAAARLVVARPDLRVESARQWGRLAAQGGDWDLAVEGLGLAVELGALVVPRSLGRADQEYQLGVLSGLGEEAAAVALQAGQLDTAVALFEHGRGVLFAQVLDARSDLTDLQDAHPEVAGAFVHLRDELDRLSQPDKALFARTEVDPVRAAWREADRRREAASEFDQLVAQIRRMPGFERFLLPLPVAELLPAAAGGPLVLINVAELRSDALIVTSLGVDVLPLPGLDPVSVEDQVNAFLAALVEAQDPDPGFDPARRDAAEQQLAAVLGWLWDQITGPILDRLGQTAKPADGAECPRVWWCPAGPLAMLPLHAAGHHNTRFDERPETVIDRVVSSNTPTVRALLQSRQAKIDADGGRLLVVAMPDTPDQRNLPAATKEAELLTDLLPGRVDVLGLLDTPPATFDTVTAALPNHRWAHFSCHGASDLDNPSASHLLLTDYQTHPLTVLDLIHAQLENVELAFLSACTTARTGAALPDEPIHLAAACQLAGYQHVIATLWPISDTDAARISKHVYTTLTTTTDQPDPDRAATALHTATRQLRPLYPQQPSRWAPYTHTGP